VEQGEVAARGHLAVEPDRPDRRRPSNRFARLLDRRRCGLPRDLEPGLGLAGLQRDGRIGTGGTEPARGGGHVECLVRPHVVVAVHPGVDRFLGLRDGGERRDMVEQLLAQGFVEAFDLSRRGG